MAYSEPIVATGFETTDSTTGWAGDQPGVGYWVYDTAQFNTGSRSARLDSGNGPNYYYDFDALYDVTYYARCYFRVANITGGLSDIIRFRIQGGNPAVVKLRSNGNHVELWDGWNPAKIGGNSATIAANTWYCGEIAYRAHQATGANEYMEGRLNGVSFASTSTFDGFHQVAGRLGIPYSENGNAVTIWLDDVKLSSVAWVGPLAPPDATVNAVVSNTTVGGNTNTFANAPFYISQSNQGFANASPSPFNVTVNKPTGTLQGDLMIAAVTFGPGLVDAAPSGWTLKNSAIRWPGASANTNTYIYSRVAGAGEPASYIWSTDTDSSWNVKVLTFRNATNFGVIDLNTSPGATTQTIDAIITTTDKALGLHWWIQGGLVTTTIQSATVDSSWNQISLNSTPGGVSNLANHTIYSKAAYPTAGSTIEADTVTLDASAATASYAMVMYMPPPPDVTVTVTSTNINLTGQPVTVTVTATVIVANVVVAGQPVTVTATSPNVTITTAISNTDITGQPAIAVIIDPFATINATVTNSGIGGQPATVIIISAIAASAPTHRYKMDDLLNANPLADSLTPADLYLDLGANYPGYRQSGALPGSYSIKFNGTTKGLYFFNSSPGIYVDPIGSGSATMEFWYKYTGPAPTGERWHILGASGNNVVKLGNVYQNSIRISGPHIANGVLGYLSDTYPYEWHSTGISIADGVWHNIIMTRSVTGTVETFATYVDGVNLTTPVVFTKDLFWNAVLWRGGYSSGVADNDQYNYCLKGNIDELIFYDKALTATEAYSHYIGNTLQVSINVSSNVTNINTKGLPVNLGIQINADVANVGIRSLQPTVVTPGQVVIGANYSDVTVHSTDALGIVIGDVTKNTVPTNVSISLTDAKVKVLDDSFKFIPAADNSFTAIDATQLTSFNLEALLYNQSKYIAFKMGNIGNSPISLILSVESLNETVIPAVKFSLNKTEYTPTLTLGTILPNQVTDVIWVQFNASYLNLGKGTFKINVEQFNA